MSLVSNQILDQNGPGTNIESQHSRALRGQSGVGTGPGDEVKGFKLHHQKNVEECGEISSRPFTFRIGHPKKGGEL